MNHNIKPPSLLATGKIIIGIILIVALFFYVSPEVLYSLLVSSDKSLLILAFVAFSSLGLFEAGRLCIIFSDYGVDLTESLRLFTIGAFFNNFVPGMVGADLYQIQQMHAIKPGFIRPLSLSLYLRVSGMLVNFGFAVISIMLTWHLWSNFLEINLIPKINDQFLLIMLVSILAGSFLIISVNQGRALTKRICENFLRIVNETVSVSVAFSFKAHAIVGLLGTLVIFSRVLSLVWLTSALGETIAFLNVLLAVTVTRIALLLPISFAGLGISELTIAAIFIASGVSPSTAISVTLIARFYSWVISLAGGIWLVSGSTRTKFEN